MEIKPIKDELKGRWTIEGLESSEMTFNRLCQLLRSGKNFKFARYGDGEFNAIFGKKGSNCDGHEYFPDLGVKLKNSFSKRAITGIQPLALTLPYATEALKLLEGCNLVNADVLHNASIDGQLYKMVEILKDRNVVCVGPAHLVPLFDQMIIIKDKNCWLDYERTIENIRFLMEPDKVFLLCASMMSEVIIKHFEYETVTMIDCGSVFDPYVKINSRRYHHKLKLS
jgi:hypothetical protein